MPGSLALGGAVADPEDALAARTLEVALHLRHLADLAELAVVGEPRLGADHILDGLAELAPRLDALSRARAGIPS